jgi:hypothetical protein
LLQLQNSAEQLQPPKKNIPEMELHYAFAGTTAVSVTAHQFTQPCTYRQQEN